MIVRPITLRAANAFVDEHHRHSKPVRGHRWSLQARHDLRCVAVAIVGRPVARALDDGDTAEVLRVCALAEAPKGVNSMLYAACWKAWRAMGGDRMLTYTLQSESGASLRGLKEMGWRWVADLDGRPEGWASVGRPRENLDIYAQPKRRWEVTARDIFA